MDTSNNIFDYVVARIREKTVPQKRVALESGVPFSTLAKIAQGVVTDPSVHTIQKLYDYFVSLERPAAVNTENRPNPENREAA